MAKKRNATVKISKCGVKTDTHAHSCKSDENMSSLHALNLHKQIKHALAFIVQFVKHMQIFKKVPLNMFSEKLTAADSLHLSFSWD